LDITDSVISGNRFAISGGGINASGTLTVTRSTISDHTVSGTGGGIFSFSGLTMTDSSIVNNSAAEAGGLAVQREITIQTRTISNNSGIVTDGGL
jgi:hypothetical protein